MQKRQIVRKVQNELHKVSPKHLSFFVIANREMVFEGQQMTNVKNYDTKNDNKFTGAMR